MMKYSSSAIPCFKALCSTTDLIVSGRCDAEFRQAVTMLNFTACDFSGSVLAPTPDNL